jgi:hypothetical protein
MDDSLQVYFTYQHSSHNIMINLSAGLSLLGFSLLHLAILGIIIAVTISAIIYFILGRKRRKAQGSGKNGTP